MTFDYFAYGSNMLTARLRKRCIFPYKVERAYADDRIIDFSKRSKDCSGKATLRQQAGHRTPGVLFRIPITDCKILDRYEGGLEKGKVTFVATNSPFIEPETTKSSTRELTSPRVLNPISSPMIGISPSL